MSAGTKDKESNPVNLVSKIMIVEDEAIVAKDIETSLSALGYSVCSVVSSGEEALVAARQSRPDLILMDIMLKGKIDGIETAGQIRSHLDIPIIFLTAYSDERTISRAKETNAYGYLLKPFEELELHTTIEMALYKNAMERKLKQNREWLETILHSIADGVLTTNAEGLIEFCNPVAERLTGWTSDEMAMRRLAEVVCLRKNDGMTAVEINPESIIRNKVFVSPESDIVLIARDGRQTKVEYSAVPLEHFDGRKATGIVLVLRDIAAKQEAIMREQALQRRLFRAQRMESMGMLANGVAEQLHRIIGPIVEYPSVILSKMASDNDVKQDLAMVQHSARKAIEILDNLITLGQMKDCSMEPLRLNAIIEDIVNSPHLKIQKQTFPLIEFQVELAPQSLPIIGCKQNLSELITNLVFNAYASIADSGIVRLSTEFMKVNEPIPGFEVIEAGEYAVLKVDDNGPGLDEEGINRFFEPFAGKSNIEHHQRGNELGMAVAYAIIKGHKGMIDIKSCRDKKGTEIIVYFPVYTGPTRLPERSEDIDVQGIETILVVDDDSELRKTTTGYLRSIGYKVAAAQNGNEAVEFIKEAAQSQRQPIDLIILDMIMADGFDGLETYKSILQFNQRQKVILVSGFSMTDRIKSALRLGVGQCLLKPYDHEDLAKAVRTELDKPAREI